MLQTQSNYLIMKLIAKYINDQFLLTLLISCCSQTYEFSKRHVGANVKKVLWPDEATFWSWYKVISLVENQHPGHHPESTK